VNEGTSRYQGAYEQRYKDYGDSTTVARPGDLYAQGDTNVHTLVNDLSHTKNVGPYTESNTTRVTADQNIDGATAAQNNGYAFTDVQVINAAGFQGNLKLNAILTSSVVDKYLNLKDPASALAGADNVTFLYDLGGNAGGDVFDLAISSANLAAAGTGTREDFVLNIKGNGGDDTISTAIYQPATSQWTNTSTDDGFNLANATGGTAAWYVNSKTNGKLNIDAGANNDVINTVGSGDWKVTLGTGSDTYYADNTADKATWVFNTSDQKTATAVAARNLDNGTVGTIQSGDNSTYVSGIDPYNPTGTPKASLYGLKLRVVYQDVSESSNALPDAGFQGVFISKVIDVPTAANNKYIVSDLNINQAIKAAINGDPVLSKLLVAEDGPANTLIVRALSDGHHGNVDDLQVEFAIPTTVDPSDVAGYKDALGIASSSTTWNETSLASARTAAFNDLINGGSNSLFDDYGPNAAQVATGSGLGTWHTVGTGGPNVASYASAFASEGSAGGGAGTLTTGGNSGQVSDNTIYVGAGAANDSDVVVLSTGVESNDTLVWKGFGSNTVTVVNFESQNVLTSGTEAKFIFDLNVDDVLTEGAALTIRITGISGGPFEINYIVPGTFGTASDVSTHGNAIASALETELGAGWDVAYTEPALPADAARFTVTGPMASIYAFTGSPPTVFVQSSATGTDLDISETTANSSSVTNAYTIGTGVTGAPPTGANHGQDYLDFTDYGATWLGVAVLNDTTHKVAAANAWDVASYTKDTAGTLGSNSLTAAPALSTPPTAIRNLTDFRVGDKYITLTHDANATDGSAANPHQSTVYRVDLWTVAGTHRDAYAFAGSVPNTDTADQAQLIGYVDVGHVIEGAVDVNSILANITY
jgi:hypothetical protein